MNFDFGKGDFRVGQMVVYCNGGPVNGFSTFALGGFGVPGFEPWNDVVIFYGDGAPYEGLYELGTVQDSWDVQYIAEIEPGEASIYCSE